MNLLNKDLKNWLESKVLLLKVVFQIFKFFVENIEGWTMSSYPRELRRYSSKRGVAGSSLGADTEFSQKDKLYLCIVQGTMTFNISSEIQNSSVL